MSGCPSILEVADLRVRPGESAPFEAAFTEDWRRLLHHFFDPFPTVLHFERVAGRGLGETEAPR